VLSTGIEDSSEVGRAVVTAADDTAGRLALSAAGSQAAARTITVGPGGEFATLNEAITEATRWYGQYVFAADRISQPWVEIQQLSGFVMAEQVFAVSKDLSFITLTSVDPEVTISRQALTAAYGGSAELWREGEFPAFCAIYGGALPVIKTLYSMDATGDGIGTTGVSLHFGSRAVVFKNCGVKNAGWRGLYVDSSYIAARMSVWDGSGHVGSDIGTSEGGCGIRIANGYGTLREVKARYCSTGMILAGSNVNFAYANCTYAGHFPDGTPNPAAYGFGARLEGARGAASGINVSNARVTGLNVSDGADITASYSGLGVTAENCGGTPVNVEEGSTLVAFDSVISNTAGSYAVRVVGGSRVNLDGSTITSSKGPCIQVFDSDVSAFGATLTATADYAVRLGNGARLQSREAVMTGTPSAVLASDGSIHQQGTHTVITSGTVTGQRFDAIMDMNGNRTLSIDSTANAANHIRFTNAASGSTPIITPGSTAGDATVSLNIQSRGPGGLIFLRDGGAKSVASFQGVTNAVNRWAFVNSVTGNPVRVVASGDPDASMNLETPGTGTVRANGTQVEVKGHKHVAADVTGARSWAAVPASSTAAGTAGQEAYDANWRYVCVTTGAAGTALWKRTGYDIAPW
jgi:hypothetical protein